MITELSLFQSVELQILQVDKLYEKKKKERETDKCTP